MTTGRFERSEDGGITWEVIDPQVMRRRLASAYRDVEAVIEVIIEGQLVRTAFAFYRFSR